MADLIKEISNRAEQALDIADQAVIDKDKLNELKFNLHQIIATSMLTGKGSSITKITICSLISFVVVTVMLKWLLGQGLGDDGLQVLTLITPLIGMLTGAYATGKTIQKVTATKNDSQTAAGSNYKTRSPKPYQPTYKQTRRPSDTIRDHPGGRK